jgi:transposase
MMAPLVRRTWAPRGRTPILRQRGRTHEKVSLIAALSVSPIYRRVGLYFSLHPNANIKAVDIVAFLRQLVQQLQRPLVVVWDRLNAHAAKEVAVLLYDCRRIHVEFLPPYSPELNPAEVLWGHLKMNPLANLAAQDATSLADIARQHMRRIRDHRKLLRSFIRATPLSSCLK